jgi:hypothetical protein
MSTRITKADETTTIMTPPRLVIRETMGTKT